MEKLKPIARELLDLKKEILNNSNPPIVKKALEVTVDRMLAEGFIDLEMQLYLKDEGYKLKDVEELIYTIPKYIKSDEELLEEYSKITEKLDTMLKEYFPDEDYYINTDLKTGKINICKILSLEEKYLKKYFYFKGNTAESFEKMMKKGGFIQQFSMLRLPRILSNFISMQQKSNKYKINKSHVYYQSEKKCYSIDLVFSLSVDTIETIEENRYILDEIHSMIIEGRNYFEEKLLY